LFFVAAALVVFYIAAVYQKGRLPVSFEPAVVHGQSNRANVGDGEMPQGDDPCGGTGGLGMIVSLGSHAITVKSRDGRKQLIKLTDRTKIRNSAGAILMSNLKIGNRVTIVTFESDPDGNKIAAVVLICNASSPETQ
ncbi:MAG TPA: hypothetical protein VK541_21800, partial [Pedobacter sp.]|uniref:hypothetical protein n=1 Tax=Pedobacter sp. TaxID=1411316 RepID=UPI002C6A94FB